MKKQLVLMLKVLGVPAVLVVLALFCLIVVYAYPKAVAEYWGSDPPVFNVLSDDDPSWNKEKNIKLIAEYKRLTESWKEGLTPDEQAQAEPHAMSWAVLAGIDRLLGDPLSHGGTDYKPDPQKHYQALAPRFKWKESEVIAVEKDEEGKEKETRTRVRLLVEADTFEGTYTYEYEWKTYKEGGKTIIREVVANVIPDINYARFKTYLAQQGVTNSFDQEMVLEFAELYDENFAVDSSVFNARVAGFQVDLGKSVFTGSKGEKMLLPVGESPVTSPYGMRKDPFTGKQRFHTGVDFGVPAGTPVRSAYNGKVIYSSSTPIWGNLVIIDHGNGLTTWYAHLQARKCNTGGEIAQGDVIGFVGSTGRSTGPHLHFEVRQNGKPVNPFK
ncbi:MAG: M23 family metallopeptidase [Syntrophothermus sp.]|uniref:M23 family metallopeptidase n=1 Tax=Syntrophothermus sp. TaxID=2736299 RepID=UPI00257F676C|nr:M23 family metallopeptidase [Syntrophothermus sp.]NSW82749.1 M23 family metallopeptidase [Syntrophothermus sp.]